MKKGYIILIIVVLLVVGGFLLFRSSKTENYKNENAGGEKKMGMTPSTAPELTAEQKAEQEDAVKGTAPKTVTFDVNGGNFYFTPKTMTVKKGDTVKINFKNDGGMHNWVLDEFNAKTKTIQTGETDTISFVADKAGTFEYYCSIGSHRMMGMKGTLTVLE